MSDDLDFDKYREKIIKHFSNGITRNLILWIISKEKIHGYGIMKRLDDFLSFNECESDFKNNSSKIYPILAKMEKNELITGEWDINENNKRVKFYSITENGLIILNKIQDNMRVIFTNPSWLEYFKDMTGMEINNEKCN